MQTDKHEYTAQVLPGPTLSTATVYPFDAAPFWWLWSAHRWPSHGPARLKRRALLMAIVAWLPLVVLTALQRGPGSVDAWLTPLLDAGIGARYLIALPILVLGESLFVGRLSEIVRHLQRAAFVRRADTARFAQILATSRQLLAHHFAEVMIVLLAYVISLRAVGLGGEQAVAQWRLELLPLDTSVSSNARWWRLVVSQPLFLICVGRWCWRLLVWHRMLRSISKLDLNLVSSHPDRAGGLLFVAQSVPALAPFGFALGCGAAGTLAGPAGAHVVAPTLLGGIMAVLVGFLLALAVAPLFWLSRSLRRAQLRGVFEYGELAVRIGRRFENRWLRERLHGTHDALSAPDFSATTDAYSIVDTVYRVRLLPVRTRTLLVLVLATLLPFAPSALSLVPASELLHFATKLIL
jgi:hypothetical protein